LSTRGNGFFTNSSHPDAHYLCADALNKEIMNMNTSIFCKWLAAGVMLTGLWSGAVQAGEPEKQGENNAEDPAAEARQQDMEAAIYETWKKILPKMKKETAPRPGADVNVPEPKQIAGAQHIPTLTMDPENPIAVMSVDNPMVNANCRAEVEELHRQSYARLKNIGNQEAEAEIRHHYEELRGMLEKKSDLTPADVFRHVASCKEFCFPREVFLTSCHINAVANSARRELVLFGFNEADIPQQYADTIRSVAATVNDSPEEKVLLVGRASYPGPDDYNVALSQRRTASVVSMLQDDGVSVDRITTMTIGEYAPKLGDTVLSIYGMGEVMDSIDGDSQEERLQQLNQSVLVVVYAAMDTSPAMASHGPASLQTGG